MISKLSVSLTDKLIARGNVSESERELYIDGFFMFLSHLMYLVLACVFGLVFGCFLESIIFYIAFQLIRRYAGGYHADKEIKCEIFSALSVIASVAIIKLTKVYSFGSALLGTALLCAVLIFVFCPLDTPEKPLSKKEFKYYRKVSLTILLCILIAIIVSFCFKLNIVFAPCCVSIILEGVLVGVGQIKKLCTKKRASSDI